MDETNPPIDFSVPRRVLLLIGELHRRGYERVRISPGLAPSGCYWRCVITPRSNIYRHHGAQKAWSDGPSIRYSSSTVDEYFGWPDAPGKSVSELADLFIERCPEIVAAGQGSDEEYAAWYREMLRVTEPDIFPMAYADFDLPKDHLPTMGGRSIRLPLPPPGEFEHQRPKFPRLRALLKYLVDRW